MQEMLPHGIGDQTDVIIQWCEQNPLILANYIDNSTFFCDQSDKSYIQNITKLIDIVIAKTKSIQKEYNLPSLFIKLFTPMMGVISNQQNKNQCQINPVMLAEFLSHNDILTDEPSDDDLKHTIYINNRIKFIDILNNNKEFIPNEYNITKLSMKLFTPAMNSILNDASENQKRRIINLCVKNSFLLEQYIRENIITISNNHSKATKISNMINKINTIQLKNNHMQQKLKII
jgi:hypothetical protein